MLASRLSAEGYSVCRAETGTAALKALKLHKITHAIILNAISMRTNGARTCSSLKRAAPGVPILIYSDQKKPAQADVLIPPGSTIRKLVNRVELYSPMDKKRCLQSVWGHLSGRRETAGIHAQGRFSSIHQGNSDIEIPNQRTGFSGVQRRSLYQDLENFVRGRYEYAVHPY